MGGDGLRTSPRKRARVAGRGALAVGRWTAAAAIVVLLVVAAALLVGGGRAEAETATVTVATTPEGEPICVTCHESVSKNVVVTWRSQNHGKNGVGCPTCHNTHDQGLISTPMAKVCFGCHDAT